MESVLPICRICLNTSMECIEFQTPFNNGERNEKEGITLNYLECLCLCTQLAIKKDDGGPQCICTTCGLELQAVYTFLQKAKKSQMILEDNFKTIERVEILDEDMEFKEIDVKEKLETAEEVSDDFEDSSYIKKECIYEELDVVTGIESPGVLENQYDIVLEESNMSQNTNKSEENQNICHICKRTYTTAHLLKTHLKYHERKEVENKSDACEICGKQFSTQRYLRQHMIVHQDIRETLKCQYCNKEYVTKTALNSHERIHQGQTLQCNECGKEFSRSYEFKIHMRFHKREFPFECKLCDRTFAIKGHLRTHMWQHQGIKLECEECGKLFGSTKALNEHSFTHTVMPYPCDFCHKAYPSKQKYKVHLEKFHANETKNLDLTQLQSLTNVKNLLKRKQYVYVQVIEDENLTDK